MKYILICIGFRFLYLTVNQPQLLIEKPRILALYHVAPSIQCYCSLLLDMKTPIYIPFLLFKISIIFFFY